MSTVNKSLVAAVLAVRNGKLPAEKAAKLLASADDDGDALKQVEAVLAGDEEDFSATVAISPSLVDIVAENIDDDAELQKLGLDDTTRRTLSEIRLMKPDEPRVMDTLLSISPTRMVKDLDAEDLDIIDATGYSVPGTDTARPTVRPKDHVTTKKPSSQILRAVPRKERYDVIKEHARGGMGRILIARDNVVGRDVALKELLPGMAPSGGGGSVPANTEISHGVTERFLREAKVTGQLEHPNIVSVYEIGKNDDDSLYYTMKFVRGQTLADRLREISKDASLDKKEKFAARLKLLDNFVDVCNAIAYAHSKGVVHRDLKPENVMIGEYGETIVLDWGLARVKGQEDTVAQKLIDSTRYMSQSVVADDTNKLTMDGSIVGTPAYMSPEQARGDLDEIDEQSDVYALGAVLYQILCGKAPFDGPAAGLIIQQVLHGTPLRLSAIAPDVPPELEALVERAMAKEKSERLESARELASEIKAFRDGRTLSSYNYSMRELVARWVGRHKKSVIAVTIFLYVLVAGAVFHYVQLRNEKELVEQEKREAENQRKNAELATRSAMAAEKDARTEKDRAEKARADAEDAMRVAKQESVEKEEALQGWDQTLSDAYAMRIRLAIENKDYNGAFAFAGAALKSAEQPEARGAMLSLPEIYPLLHHLQSDTPSVQEIYQFYNVEFSPDGRFIAAGHSDGKVRLWSARTGELVQTLESGKTKTAGVAFSPSGERLLVSSWQDNIGIFDYDHTEGVFRKSALTLQSPADPGQSVKSLVISPDGRYFAAALETVYIWDLHTGRLQTKFDKVEGHDAVLLSWSPDGQTLLTTTPHFNDPFVRIWNARTGKLNRALIDMSGTNETFTAWSPDGALVASSSLQGHIRVRDGKDFRLLHTLTKHTSTVLDLDFSPDGKLMLSGSLDGTVRLWDTSDFSVRVTLAGGGIVEGVDFAPDGLSFCARDTRGNVRVWALGDGDQQMLHEHTSDVIDVCYSDDGSHFVTAGWDGSVVVWDARQRKPIRRFSVPLRQFFAADFLDGTRRIVAGGSDGVRIYDVENGELVAHVNKGEIVTSVHVPADQQSFLATHYRQSVRYDAGTFEPLGEYGRHSQLCVSTHESPTGELVVTGSYDGSVIVWDAESYKPARVLQEEKGGVYAVSFDHGGERIAVGGEDETVRVYGATDGKLLHEFKGHEGIVFSVVFSPDGKYLFSGSQDRSIRVWNLETGEVLAVLKGHAETVSRMSLSPDGRILLSASQDDFVRFWPLESLFIPRERFADIAAELTGLTVAQKQFATRTIESWPGKYAGGPNLKRERRRRSNEIDRHARAFELQFEGYRYLQPANPGVRSYLPPRQVDETGNPVGETRGRVNYAWFWADRHPEFAALFEQGAPEITEVIAGGQAEPLPLKVGDLLWKVNGKRVADRDELREVLEEIGEQKFSVTVRRYSRDAEGRPLPATDDDGNFLVDETGRTRFEPKEFEVTMQPGKLGLRIGDGRIPERPWR